MTGLLHDRPITTLETLERLFDAKGKT
jgi:hypothetical protein